VILVAVVAGLTIGGVALALIIIEAHIHGCLGRASQGIADTHAISGDVRGPRSHARSGRYRAPMSRRQRLRRWWKGLPPPCPGCGSGRSKAIPAPPVDFAGPAYVCPDCGWEWGRWEDEFAD
jgi:hypothetical protein